jgi:hypothetical protein
MAVDAGAEPMEGVETAKAAAGADGAGIPDDALSAIMAKAQEYVAAAQEGCTRLLRGKMIALALVARYHAVEEVIGARKC